MISEVISMYYHLFNTFQVETPFELKLNVTDTELVVVENAAAWDTNAIILKVSM